MGFCTQEQYHEFFNQVIPLENMLIKDGIRIIKLWFSIDIDEQKKRLEERKNNPLQQWKLSTVDMMAQQHWNMYSNYKEIMFEKTGTLSSPWAVIKGADKDLARMEAMRYVVNQIDFPGRGETGERLTPDGEIVSVIARP
jgi:polyphosphate kinase 2 (PPK2 family)